MFQKKETSNQEDAARTPEEMRAAHAKRNRNAILFISVVSIINLLLALIDSDSVMLFAPGVPYYVTRLAQAIENDFVNGHWDNGPMTMTACVISVLLTAPYFVSALLCKKSPVWALTAAILMVVDTLGLVVIGYLFMDSMLTMAMDFVMHAVMLLFLFAGWKEQKKYYDMAGESRQDPSVLRTADPEVF